MDKGRILIRTAIFLSFALVCAVGAPSGVAGQLPPQVPPRGARTSTARPPDPDSLRRANAPAVAAKSKKPVGFGVIDGIVTDTNLVPLNDANVAVLSSSVKVSTGTSGRFRLLAVPAGQYLLIVRKLGFHPTSVMVEVPVNDTVRLAYALEPVVQTLGTVTVTEERRSFKMMQFEDRKALGFGEFMSQDQIAKSNNVYVTELIRHFKSVKILDVPGGGGSFKQMAVSTRGGGSAGQRNCVMGVVVDDVIMPSGFDLEWLPPPSNLAGIEVYAGASTVPLEYKSYDSGCGVIVIWTKDGG